MATSTGSLTAVDTSVTHTVADRDELVTITMTDADQMTMTLGRELGAPGSGAWETIKEWVSGDAAVTYMYRSKTPNEKLRLYCTLDGGGTNVCTFTDSDKKTWGVTDMIGNDVVQADQTNITFTPHVVLTNGITGGAPVAETSSSLTLTQPLHAGRVVAWDIAGTSTITLPAATGTGDAYTIFVGTTATGDHIIQAASSADSIGGGVAIATDIGGVVMLTAATTDTITMSGTTTGGVLGSWVRLTDVASGKFMLEGFLVSTGAEATPFSAAV